jgi:hypothetical protein
MQTKARGKFWPHVRCLIWERAQGLFQQDQARALGSDFSSLAAEHSELREAGYFHTAKLLVLRDLWLQKKGLPTSEEEEHAHGHF